MRVNMDLDFYPCLEKGKSYRVFEVAEWNPEYESYEFWLESDTCDCGDSKDQLPDGSPPPEGVCGSWYFNEDFELTPGPVVCESVWVLEVCLGTHCQDSTHPVGRHPAHLGSRCSVDGCLCLGISAMGTVL